MQGLVPYPIVLFKCLTMAIVVGFLIIGCGSQSSAPEKETDSAAIAEAATSPTPSPAASPAAAAVSPVAGAAGKVTITWGTESEQECYGFNVMRARSAEGPFEKANKKIVRGGGTTHVPRRYQLVDEPLPMAQTFYYKVQQIDLTGAKRDISPVTACTVTQTANLTGKAK